MWLACAAKTAGPQAVLCDTRPHFLAIDLHGARSALRHAAAETRTSQLAHCPTKCCHFVERGVWSETTELANFDDDEGHIVDEGTVPPGIHAIEDGLLHLSERSVGRLADQRSQTFDAEHVVKTVEHFD